jgi:hypothetical protein
MMFGLGPATKIYIAVEAIDMRNYAPSVDMRSPGSGHNAADFYANVLHAMSTPALTDRQIIASVRDHVSPQER